MGKSFMDYEGKNYTIEFDDSLSLAVGIDIVSKNENSYFASLNDNMIRIDKRTFLELEKNEKYWVNEVKTFCSYTGEVYCLQEMDYYLDKDEDVVTGKSKQFFVCSESISLKIKVDEKTYEKLDEL